MSILLALSLTGCGANWRGARAAGQKARVAPAAAPEIPLPLPRAESFPKAKAPLRLPTVDQIESHVWAWASRQVESGQLTPPPGPLTAAIDAAARSEARAIGELAAQVTRLVPLADWEAAGDALRYFESRYGISGEFRPVMVALAPVNRMGALRDGAHVGGGTVGGAFYVPKRDAWLGPIDREALIFAFGTPYVVFLEDSEATGWSRSAVLVHELKHYLDYRRDPSPTPTYAEPALIGELRKRARDSYWLRAGEVSAFLEETRYYKHWLNLDEKSALRLLLGDGQIAPLIETYFRILYRAG